MSVLLQICRSFFPAAIFVFALTSPADAAELNPAAITIKLPNEIKWRDPFGVSDINKAILDGGPSRAAMSHVYCLYCRE